MLKTQTGQKIRAVVALSAVLALALTGCSGSSASDAQSATPSAAGTAGPPVWSADETQYLDAINGANLASSTFLSASDYITIGDTVCSGLKQDLLLEDILSALASSGKANGLNENQRNDFTLITSAAAVSFLCKDQIEKYKLTK